MSMSNKTRIVRAAFGFFIAFVVFLGATVTSWPALYLLAGVFVALPVTEWFYEHRERYLLERETSLKQLGNELGGREARQEELSRKLRETTGELDQKVRELENRELAIKVREVALSDSENRSNNLQT